jgi:hypothetical protein
MKPDTKIAQHSRPYGLEFGEHPAKIRAALCEATIDDA